MAKQVFKDATCLIGALDFSADTNQLSFDAGADEVDVTTFASQGWKEFLPGLRKGEASFEGFRELPEPDASAFDYASEIPLSVTKTNPVAEGDVAYSLRSIKTKYMPGGRVGEAEKLNLSFVGDKPMVRGVALNVIAADGNGNSTPIQHGQVPAGKKLYAVLHVIAWNATTLDLVLESDTVGFPSPITRITFDQVSGVGYQWKELDGPITDDYWRIARTLVGTSATFRVFIAIQ